MQTLSYILFVALVILQFADIYTTYRAISSGKAYEANPIMNMAFNIFGFVPAMLLKLVIVTGVGIIWMQHSLIGLVMLIALVAFYIWVVYNNSRSI